MASIDTETPELELPEPAEETLGEGNTFGGARVREDDHEFVTPVAGRQVRLTNHASQQLSDRLEDSASDHVAMAVIDGLQLVDVHHDDG